MPEYLIWSNEHRGWWRMNHRGYTVHLHLAARFTEEEADRIVANAMLGGPTPEGEKPEVKVYCGPAYPIERGAPLELRWFPIHDPPWGHGEPPLWWPHREMWIAESNIDDVLPDPIRPLRPEEE